MSETEVLSLSKRTSFPRRHEIDALRSIALIMLIAYHVFIAFQPAAAGLMFIGFRETLEEAWFLGEWLNPWRIPVLFLIAGITGGYLLQNRSVGKLLKSRVMRLVPPLLFTTFFIGPISPVLMQIYTGGNARYLPNPAHLWFVMNLVVYFVFAFPLLVWLKRQPDNWCVRMLRFISPWGWLIMLPAMLFLIPTILEPHIGPEMFGFHAFRFWYGFASFIVGLMLVSVGDRFWQGIRKVCHVALPVAFAFYVIRMAEVDYGGKHATMVVLTVESTYGMLAFIGYGSLLFSRPSRVFTFLNQSVFPVYIIHMPVQQVVAFFLFRAEINAWLAFVLHLSGTLLISYLIYTYGLRSMRWLYPFFGIAPVKSLAQSAATGDRSTSEFTWPIRVGRFSTLYVVTPLLVIATSASMIYARIVMSNLAKGSQGLEISEAAMQSQKVRFQNEIAARSPEQNRTELESLQESLREARRDNNKSRVEILDVEIQLIEEALEKEETGNNALDKWPQSQ